MNCVLITACVQTSRYTAANAHAHNDYNHPRPFYSAYNAAFGSIEADIFLKDGQLYVAHDFGDIRSERTIAALYLDPLRKMIENNKGHVYADSLKQLLLLVDLKTSAESTLDVLLKLLQQYKTLTDCASLTIVISGNRPDPSKWASYPAWISFDGRLNQQFPASALDKVALISDNFRNYSTWKGEGMLAKTDRKKIRGAVAAAHKLHKPIRFWATPDSPGAWRQLKKLRVDYINTDKIQELANFLSTH